MAELDKKEATTEATEEEHMCGWMFKLQRSKE